MCVCARDNEARTYIIKYFVVPMINSKLGLEAISCCFDGMSPHEIYALPTMERRVEKAVVAMGRKPCAGGCCTKEAFPLTAATLVTNKLSETCLGLGEMLKFRIRCLILVFILVLYLIVAHFVVILEIGGKNGINLVSNNNQTQQVLPSCIVIGVRKGGTRALIDMISLHSKVFSAKNEIHFFDNDENYAKGYSWYKSQMPLLDPNNGEIGIEKTPSYFNTEKVPERIFRMNKELKFLLVVRDPVVRLISDYTQIRENHRDKGRPFPPFEQIVLSSSNGSINTAYEAVKKSIYVVHLRRWLQYFPPDQLHVVNGDRFIRKPWQELRKVEQFLGISHEIQEELFFFNATKGFHCVVQKIPSSPSNQTKEKCLAKSKGRPHPKVSIEVVRKLRNFFSPFNYEFYTLIGRDFGWPED